MDDSQTITSVRFRNFKALRNTQSKAADFFRRQRSTSDGATVGREAVKTFNKNWLTLETRLHLIPGKTVLAKLNSKLQAEHAISLTPITIIAEMTRAEIAPDLVALVHELDEFRRTDPPERTSESPTEQ